MNNPAGWYPDPSNAPQTRYWDGGEWTNDTRPFEPPKAPKEEDKPTKTANPAAWTGFALGVVSSFLGAIPWFGQLLCISAIVVSIVGLSRYSPEHGKASRVFAIIGLALGIVYLIAGIGLAFARRH